MGLIVPSGCKSDGRPVFKLSPLSGPHLPESKAITFIVNKLKIVY